MIAKDLADQYVSVFRAGKTRNLDEMARWYNRAREYLQNVEVTNEQAWRIELAYRVGRGERELMQLCGGFARALKIRNGMCEVDEQREAAQKAHQLEADGLRNFVAVVADEYGVHPKTVGRWMKRYPPITRT